jgi:hypothetical protein
MNQTQNISLGHGFVNNGTMVVHPMEVVQAPMQLPGEDPAFSRPDPPSPLVRAVNFIGWTLLTSAVLFLLVAFVAVARM